MIEDLRTDYKSDILMPVQQNKRTFNIVDSNNNIIYENVHIEDNSQYLQVGDEYGSEVINEQNESINSMDDKLDELIEFMDNGIDATDVNYNDSNVKLALDTVVSNLGSKSSASAVTGNDAFAKIATLNTSKQNALTNPLTKADVVNNLTTATTNVPLSAAQGKKLGAYPKIFNCIGVIANAVSDSMQGTGVATVILYASGLAKIDYQYTITTAGSSSATSNFKWGLNRDLLTARNSSVPIITPINGGVATWYNPISGNNWSTFNNSFNGYGCTHGINEQFWCAARNHNGTDVGSYAVSNAGSNQRICGTCYGTFAAT